MSEMPAPWLARYRYEPTTIALAYRWATLVVGLVIALFEESLGGWERIALLAPIAASAVVTGLAIRSSSSRWLTLALIGEVGVAAVTAGITGHRHSALHLYLTAPVVHAALLNGTRLLLVLNVSTVSLFIAVLATNPAPMTFRLSATIQDIALLLLLPILVKAIATTAARHGRGTSNLALHRDDLAVAAELAHGATYKEIADVLHMSPESVKVAVGRLYRRLGAHNREEAVRLIHDFGLLNNRRPGPPPERAT